MMVFYDQDVKDYTLCLAVPGAMDAFPVEVQLGVSQDGHDYARFYDRIGQAVVDYLNDGVLLGIAQRDDVSPEQKTNFQKYIPTKEEEEILRRFLDEVVATNNLAGDDFFVGGIPTQLVCKLSLSIKEGDSGELYPSVRHSFEKVFDLFLFECYELLKERRLKKCQQCGRYFFPGRSKAKFCSNSCRSASHSANSSPEYKAYRKANDTKHKQLCGQQISLDAYNHWQDEARGAMDAYSKNELTWSEYETVLKKDIRQK